MDFVVKLHEPINTDPLKVKSALAKLTAAGGGDLPEAQMPAMYHALTGAELKYEGGSVAKKTAPAGRIGPIGFRAGSLPVIILVNDIDWHEPGSPAAYDAQVTDTVSMTMLADAFKAANARFVSISESGMSAEGHDRDKQPDTLSDLTNSSVPPEAFTAMCPAGKCCTGLAGAPRDPAPGGRCRLNFHHKGGEGVSSSLITAINGLSIGSTFDVTAAGVGADRMTDGSAMIKSTNVLPAGDAALGCGPQNAKDTNGDGSPDAYDQVPAKTPVCFRVDLHRNTTAPAGVKPTILGAYVDVLGDPGKILLDRRTIVFVVPPSP
jgi:hypothetical protein